MAATNIEEAKPRRGRNLTADGRDTMGRAKVAEHFAEARKQLDKAERSLAEGSWGGAARAFDAASQAVTEARWQSSKLAFK